MSFINLSNPRLAMLLACGNPGSAAAYFADAAADKPAVLRRDSSATAEPAGSGDAAASVDRDLSQLVASGRVLLLP